LGFGVWGLGFGVWGWLNLGAFLEEVEHVRGIERASAVPLAHLVRLCTHEQSPWVSSTLLLVCPKYITTKYITTKYITTKYNTAVQKKLDCLTCQNFFFSRLFAHF
jgi:hypothetical protein